MGTILLMDGRKVYDDLVKAHSAELFRFSYRLCGDRDAAEDLVQETFFEAWRSLSNLKSAAAARFWLFKILRHRFYHWLRGRKRRPELSQVGEEFSIEFDVEILKQDDALQQALNILAPEYKEVFLLVFLNGWSCREVAEHLELSLGTVLSRIHRARCFLKQNLNERKT